MRDEEVGVSQTDWVRIHCERLRAAQEVAQENLRQAASKRKLQHDKHVKGEVLKVGDVVLLRDHPLGRHKLHDHWKAEKYLVRMLPDRDGAPVVVEPVGGGELRRVSANELKKLKAPVPAPRTKIVRLPTFVPEVQPKAMNAAREDSDVSGSRTTDDELSPPAAHRSPCRRERQSRNQISVESSSDSEESESDRTSVKRRSKRSNAGQHSNQHRLPRSVAVKLLEVVSDLWSAVK
jgi:hypothetical protein